MICPVCGKQFCTRHFNEWWDPNKFDWKGYSFFLAEFCTRYFDIWWDSDKYNWQDSRYLAEYCSDHFPKWWNSERFNWQDGCWHLVKYC